MKTIETDLKSKNIVATKGGLGNVVGGQKDLVKIILITK